MSRLRIKETWFFNKLKTIIMQIENWKEENNSLYKKFTFNNFSEAVGFIARVALAAEKLNHHPNWSNVYNIVEIKLSTHDKGNTVTELDRKLAIIIDQLL